MDDFLTPGARQEIKELQEAFVMTQHVVLGVARASGLSPLVVAKAIADTKANDKFMGQVMEELKKMDSELNAGS